MSYAKSALGDTAGQARGRLLNKVSISFYLGAKASTVTGGVKTDNVRLSHVPKPRVNDVEKEEKEYKTHHP